MLERRGFNMVLVYGEDEVASVDIRLWESDQRECRRFFARAGVEYWCGTRPPPRAQTPKP